MKKHNITPDNIRDYMNNYESDFPLVIDDKAGLDYKDEKTRAIPHNSCIYQKKEQDKMRQVGDNLVSWYKLGSNTLLRQIGC